jgi:intracellular sulfur oxidation DsrE/DsrF family protein
MKHDGRTRRRLVAGLGAAAGAIAVGTRRTEAGEAAAFEPVRHAQDDWMSKMPGKHRVVLDVTTPEGMPDAIRFVGNLYTGHQTGYNVPESDLAIIVVLRHSATAYGYDNALWSTHGKVLDAKAATPPTGNPYDSGDRVQLSALAKRGVQFMVCGTASRGISRRLAGEKGDADAVFKEMETHLIRSARLVPAGVVGATHAQEHGFSYLFVG